MIPRFKPYVKLRDLRFLRSAKALLSLPKQSFRTPTVYEEFETSFAKLTGSKYALLLPYGRSALYFFLKSFQITQQEIILPAYNCQSVIGPILETRNIPVFIDSKDDDFNMDEQRIPGAITAKTKVILASAMYGSPLSLDFYKSLRGKGIYLIGDYALGFLTFLTKQKEEVLETFDLTFFSFGLSKEITFLSGGVVITHKEEIFLKVKAYRDEFCKPPDLKFTVKILAKFLGAYILFSPLFYRILYFLSEKTSFLDKEKGATIGIYNNLPDDFVYLPITFQVRLALDRLHHIEEFIQEKNQMITYYYQHLEDKSGKRFHLPRYLATYSHLPILVDKNDRNNLLHFFLIHQIHSTVIFKTPLNFFYKESQEIRFEHAERYTQTVVLLPLYHKMSYTTIQQTLNILQTWLNRI